MQKWEYDFWIIDAKLVKIKAEGKEHGSKEYMNHLGKQGWELVSTEQLSPGNIFSDYILWFKRPIEE